MAEVGNKVSLHIYDLSGGVARQLSTAFLGKTIEGIWHTGVVVYGNEYFFGGGIQCVPAGTTVYGTPVKVVELGVTYLTKEVFEDYLREISPRYTMGTYNLFSHNCNNFSNEVAQFLVGSTIPSYIIGLPNEVLNSPGAALLRPMFQQMETTLNVGGDAQIPQFLRPPPASQTSPKEEATSQSRNAPVDNIEGGKENAVPCEPPRKEDVCVSTREECAGNDPLASARSKVQDEITKEFAALMASGTLRASEAAALAARKVMERYGSSSTNVATRV